MSYGIGPHDYDCDCWRCKSRRFDPYDKSEHEKAEAIAKGIVGDGTKCPQCGVSFARWLLGSECQISPHEWHSAEPGR